MTKRNAGWLIWLFPLFAATAVAGIGYGLIVRGRSPTDPDMIANAAIALVLGGLWLHFQHARREDRRLMTWLHDNADAIRHGGATYRDVLITPATQLRTFDATVSIVIATLNLPSRHLIVGHDNRLGHGAACTLTSLVLGWWGIPWGPIWTIAAVARNLRGGHKTTVGALLENTAPIQRQE